MKKLMLLIGFILLAGCGNDHTFSTVPPGPQGPPGVDGRDGDDASLPIDIYDAKYDGTVNILCGGESFVSDLFNLSSIMLGAGNPGQNGWSSSDNSKVFNESIYNAGSDACRGSGVWKVNSDNISTAFGNQTSSPPMAQTAGESDLRSAGGGDTMETTFFFKTISPVADGTAIEIDFANTNSSDRHNALYLINAADANGGLKMYSPAQTSAISYGYKYYMSRNTWHHVRMININRDGVNLDGTGNDIVRVYIDGVLSFQASSMEQARRYGDFCSPVCPGPSYAVNRMMFRIARASTAVDPSFTTPQGFMFDDFTTKVYNRSNPSDIKAIYQTGFEF